MPTCDQRPSIQHTNRRMRIPVLIFRMQHDQQLVCYAQLIACILYASSFTRRKLFSIFDKEVLTKPSCKWGHCRMTSKESSQLSIFHLSKYSNITSCQTKECKSKKHSQYIKQSHKLKLQRVLPGKEEARFFLNQGKWR